MRAESILKHPNTDCLSLFNIEIPTYRGFTILDHICTLIKRPVEDISGYAGALAHSCSLGWRWGNKRQLLKHCASSMSER